jgi:predicted metal-dependent HD superfamily phosphohydrolase
MKYSYLKDFLAAEWKKVSATVFKDDAYSAEVFKIIQDFYCENGRHYHTLEHIAACLNFLNSFLKESIDEKPWNIDAVRLAIWFHDIIYNSKAKDNEERSANLARTLILGAKPELRQLPEDVHHLIMLTKHTNDAPTNLTFEEKLLLDLDLSILGMDDGHFEKYEIEIRKEYMWVDNDMYNIGRLRIIVGFLNREKIFHTKYFSDLYELSAFRNLNASRIQIRKELELVD